MSQNFSNIRPVPAQPGSFALNKRMLVLLAFFSLLFATYTAYESGGFNWLAGGQSGSPETRPAMNDFPAASYKTDSVAGVVTKALYLKTLLSASQVSTLEQTYTTSLARKWSNLPCGSGCRNGIQLGTLTGTQLAAALDVIQSAMGTATNDGYDEFRQVRLADKYLGLNGGGNGYDSTIYFLSYLNTPTTTGAWMLQFGGHHYAANIAFNGGKVVGTTPHFMGLEPLSFTLNNVTYAPLKQERDSLIVMLASLSQAQLASAKINNTYMDVTMSPGETNVMMPYSFPATKVGLKANTLTTAQQNLILAAIRNYTRDIDDSSGNIMQNLYASKIDSTYIAWTGSGTAADSSTFLNANTNYVRIDGPDVWIEFICQTGVVFRNQIHYHTVYRDHNRDYGTDLTRTSLPLTLLGFDAVIEGKGRMLSWSTADEKAVSHFEVQRAVSPSVGYTAIKTIATAGNGKHTYTYLDNGRIDDDVIYYRLKIVDLDGYSRYSNVAVVKYNGADKGIALYPNPASDLLTIASSELMQNATIRVINNAGTVVLSSANRAGRKLNVDVSGLPTGSYFVQLIDNGKVSTLRFVKQR